MGEGERLVCSSLGGVNKGFIGCAEQKLASATVKVFKLLGGCYKLGKPISHQKRRPAARVSVVILFRSSVV